MKKLSKKIQNKLNKLESENSRLLLEALIEDGLLEESKLEETIFRKEDSKNELFLICFHDDDIHILINEDDVLLLSIRFDASAYFVAKFMETIISLGIDYYIVNGWGWCNDYGGIKNESEMTDSDWAYVFEPKMFDGDKENI